MMKNKLFAPVALAAFLITANGVYAQDASGRISWSELTQKLENQGYRIHEIDTKYNGWEAEVSDKDHIRYELYLDNQGNILRKKIDD